MVTELAKACKTEFFLNSPPGSGKLLDLRRLLKPRVEEIVHKNVSNPLIREEIVDECMTTLLMRSLAWYNAKYSFLTLFYRVVHNAIKDWLKKEAPYSNEVTWKCPKCDCVFDNRRKCTNCKLDTKRVRNKPEFVPIENAFNVKGPDVFKEIASRDFVEFVKSCVEDNEKHYIELLSQGYSKIQARLRSGISIYTERRVVKKVAKICQEELCL